MSNVIQFPGTGNDGDGGAAAPKRNFREDLTKLVLDSLSEADQALAPCVVGRIHKVLDKYGEIPRREISFNFSQTLSSDDETHLHAKITENYGEFIGGYVQPMLIDLCFAQVELCRAEMLTEEER